MAFSAVYFDCDSTLSEIEGIDELARKAAPAVRSRIESLTADAMDGRVPLERVYAERLEIVRPSRAALDEVGRTYVERVVPGVREVVEVLARLGKHVGIVSGGLEPAVLCLARALGIPPSNVHAVPLFFDDEGRYAGFDADSPLARAGGKIEVLDRISSEHGPLCFVGDGITDLEAQNVVEAFVGYGGVVRRDAVADGARTYLEEKDLRALLDIVLTPEERRATRGV